MDNKKVAKELVKIAKNLTASESMIDFVVNQEDLARLDRAINDDQTYDLMVEVYKKLRKDLEITDDQREAINRLKISIRGGTGMQSDAHRNNIFKAAHALGIKLPSSMF